MFTGFFHAPSAARRSRRPRRAGYVPRLDEPLERREVLTPFPLAGTFSGSYTVLAQNGAGYDQTISGTITVTIQVISGINVGDGYTQDYLTGMVTVTGFYQASATYPYSGSYADPVGIETGYNSSDPESTNELNIQAFYQDAPQNFVDIDGSGLTDSFYVSVNIGLGNYSTPNAASVTLNAVGSGGGGGGSPSPNPTPNPAELTGGSWVQSRKGPSRIVVDFQGALGGGSGLPVSDFRLTTDPGGRKHPKVIPLAGASYNSANDTVTLTSRRKLSRGTKLELTIGGLSGGPTTLILSKHGVSVAAVAEG